MDIHNTHIMVWKHEMHYKNAEYIGHFELCGLNNYIK